MKRNVFNDGDVVDAIRCRRRPNKGPGDGSSLVVSLQHQTSKTHGTQQSTPNTAAATADVRSTNWQTCRRRDGQKTSQRIESRRMQHTRRRNQRRLLALFLLRRWRRRAGESRDARSACSRTRRRRSRRTTTTEWMCVDGSRPAHAQLVLGSSCSSHPTPQRHPAGPPTSWDPPRRRLASLSSTRHRRWPAQPIDGLDRSTAMSTHRCDVSTRSTAISEPQPRRCKSSSRQTALLTRLERTHWSHAMPMAPNKSKCFAVVDPSWSQHGCTANESRNCQRLNRVDTIRSLRIRRGRINSTGDAILPRHFSHYQIN